MCVGAICVFFQAEDGIRDLVRSRGLGDVYKRQRQGLLDRRKGVAHALRDVQDVRLRRNLDADEDRALSLIHI